MEKKKWLPFIGMVLGFVGIVFLIQAAFGSSEDPVTTAHASDSFQKGTIIVSEVGEVRLEPDMAYINLGAEVVNASADEAQKLVNERMKAIRNVIDKYKIDNKDVRTAYLSVHPDYQHDPYGNRSKEEQFRAQHILEIQFRQMDKLGEFIDAVSKVGANRIQQVRFGLQDSQEAEHKALKQAIEKTASKADVAAIRVGRKIRDVLDELKT